MDQFNFMDDDDDLMGDRSTYNGMHQEYNEPTARGDKLDSRLDSERMLIDKLQRENMMKDEAVEKASNLIELLTTDLEIKERTYNENIKALEAEYKEKLEAAKMEEKKLLDKIAVLEKKNQSLEIRMRNRSDLPNGKELKPRSSVRSIMRQSHSQQRKIQSSRMIRYVKESPKKKKQQDDMPKKPVSLMVTNVKKTLFQLLQQESSKIRNIDDILEREEQGLDEYMEQMQINKEEIKYMVDTDKPQYFQPAPTHEMITIIRQQQNIIMKMKAQEQDLKQCTRQFLSILLTQQQAALNYSPSSQHINDLEKLLNVISRMIRDRFSKRRVNTEELKSLRQTNNQLHKISQLYLQIRYYLGLKEGSNHQQLIRRIEALKQQLKGYENENADLKGIIQGLIRIAKK